MHLSIRENHTTGVGKPETPVVIPVLANAIHAAIGQAPLPVVISVNLKQVQL